MGKLQPVALWLACGLFSLQAWADDKPASITTQGLAQQQELPSLDGPTALPLNAPAPGILTLNDAVNRSVSWHPGIREAIGKLYGQSEQINVAKSKYYPQISAGMNNGSTTTYSNSGYSPSLVLSLSQMLYDFGKVAS